jgi:hypothetical protein
MNKQPDATPKTDSGAGTAQGALVLFLLLVGAGSGGYYLGTQANFNQMDPGRTAGAASGMASWFAFAPQMKRRYWIHTKGYERAGYTITVAINGQTVDKFYKPDVDVDVTKFIHPGKNLIAFDAKSLPLDQRQDNQSAYLTIELRSAEKKDQENAFEGGDILVEYTREVVDTQDFNDKKEFEPVE